MCTVDIRNDDKETEAARHQRSNALTTAHKCLALACGDMDAHETLIQDRLVKAEDWYQATVASVHASQTFQWSARQVEDCTVSVRDAEAQLKQASMRMEDAFEQHVWGSAPLNEAHACLAKARAAIQASQTRYNEAVAAHQSLVDGHLQPHEVDIARARAAAEADLRKLSQCREKATVNHQDALKAAHDRYTADLESTILRTTALHAAEIKTVRTAMEKAELRHAIARANADTRHAVALAKELEKAEQRQLSELETAVRDAVAVAVKEADERQASDSAVCDAVAVALAAAEARHARELQAALQIAGAQLEEANERVLQLQQSQIVTAQELQELQRRHTVDY